MREDPPWEEFTPPWCRGSYALGSACGSCDKCKWERGEWPQKESKLSEEQNAAPVAETPAAPAAQPDVPPTSDAEPVVETEKRVYLPCPDGSIPEKLIIEVNQDSKIGRVSGDSCPDWGVDFLRGNTVDQEKILDKAQAAWNAAPRAT